MIPRTCIRSREKCKVATSKNRKSAKPVQKSASSTRAPLVKASFSSGGAVDITRTVELVTSDEQRLPGGAKIPAYDADKLYGLYEQSAWLRPCVEAYVTNIDSFGHHFVPGIDLSTDIEADTRIRDSIFYERVLASQDGKLTPDKVVDPTPEEVKERKERLRRVARLEYARLKAFFSHVCPQFSFVELRRRSRQDLEVCGNAYWELTRNKLREIANLYYVKPQRMRLLPEGEDDVEVTERVKVTDITWAEMKRRRRFKKFMMLRKKSRPIYFKEYGDPRIMSRASGTYYATEQELQAKEKGALPATEIIHFTIFSPASDYGIPRWIANLPSVFGSRELDEVNYNYFSNNVVPPLALLCSGGRFGKGVAQKIEEYIDEHLKGKKGVHRILVLEAEGQKSSSGDSGPRQVPKIQFVPLRDVQLQDALFQEYDKQNEAKIAKSFRLPRILRGDDSQINRATAFAALKFAEEQVFEPERQIFDEFMDRHIMPELNITFWLFRSNSPIVRDPEAMTEMVVNMVKAGVLLPSEARQLAADIFNRAFIEVSEEWSNRPLPLILAQLRTGDLTALEIAPRAKPPEETVVQPAGNGAGASVPRMPRSAGQPLPPIGEGDTTQVQEST